MLKKIEIKTTHPDCWASPLTERYPGLCLVSNGGYRFGNEIWVNFVVSSGNRDTLKKFLENYKKEFHGYPLSDIEVVASHGNSAEMHAVVDASHSFYDVVLKCEMMPLEVTVYGGSEYWTVITHRENLPKVLKRISDRLNSLDDYTIEIESITNLTSLKTEAYDRVFESVMKELSLKQKEMLVRAYRGGYYSWPRGKNITQLADELKISKVTCLHHLRKAEIKVMNAFIKELIHREKFLENF